MKSIRPYLYVFYLPGQQCVHMSGVMLHEFLHAIKARHVGLLTENADDIRILSPGGTSADLWLTPTHQISICIRAGACAAILVSADSVEGQGSCGKKGRIGVMFQWIGVIFKRVAAVKIHLQSD